MKISQLLNDDVPTPSVQLSSHLVNVNLNAPMLNDQDDTTTPDYVCYCIHVFAVYEPGLSNNSGNVATDHKS